MGRFTMAILVILAVAAIWAFSLPAPSEAPASMLFRICDGIGRQFACISSSMGKTQYGFGGVADTLATDSTVSRGTWKNLRRVYESGDQALAEMLPLLMTSRKALDSSYMYGKWSAVCWGLNNFYALYGGLSGIASTWGQDSGRFSPRFAQVARANGIYLAPKVVYSPEINFCYVSLSASDSVVTFQDSLAIDSTRYGADVALLRYTHGSSVNIACTVKVFGANQNLVHGRAWRCYINPEGAGHDSILAPYVATDSLYNVDSVKIKMVSGDAPWGFKITNYNVRTDSL